MSLFFYDYFLKHKLTPIHQPSLEEIPDETIVTKYIDNKSVCMVADDVRKIILNYLSSNYVFELNSKEKTLHCFTVDSVLNMKAYCYVLNSTVIFGIDIPQNTLQTNQEFIVYIDLQEETTGLHVKRVAKMSKRKDGVEYALDLSTESKETYQIKCNLKILDSVNIPHIEAPSTCLKDTTVYNWTLSHELLEKLKKADVDQQFYSDDFGMSNNWCVKLIPCDSNGDFVIGVSLLKLPLSISSVCAHIKIKCNNKIVWLANYKTKFDHSYEWVYTDLGETRTGHRQPIMTNSQLYRTSGLKFEINIKLTKVFNAQNKVVPSYKWEKYQIHVVNGPKTPSYLAGSRIQDCAEHFENSATV